MSKWLNSESSSVIWSIGKACWMPLSLPEGDSLVEESARILPVNQEKVRVDVSRRLSTPGKYCLETPRERVWELINLKGQVEFCQAMRRGRVFWIEMNKSDQCRKQQDDPWGSAGLLQQSGMLKVAANGWAWRGWLVPCQICTRLWYGCDPWGGPGRP